MIPTTIPVALRHKCPVCDAEIGERCRAMNQTAYPKPRKNIHPERRQPGMSTVAAAKAMRAARPEQFGRNEFRGAEHGTNARYSRGCRCDDCRSAHSAYQMAWAQAQLATLAPDDPRHGTTHGYRGLGCRCDRCSRAAREYAHALYERNKAAAQIGRSA